jgi:hypothetical protein
MKRADILKELQRINDKIPQEYKDNLIKEEMTEDMTRMAMRMANNMELPAAERDRFREGLDKGIFKPHLEKRVDPFWQKKIDDYLTEKVEEAIKSKRIPPPQRDQFVKKVLSKYKI